MKTDILLSAAELSPVYALLCSLGVSANYIGFFHSSCAVYLALQNPERMLLVTKWLYPEVAGHYGTSWHCVERNIRTVSKRAWTCNRLLLESLACRPLPHPPSASDFLAILASYLISPRAA